MNGTLTDMAEDLINTSNYGNLEIVKFLVEQGANINLRDNNRWAALILTSIHGKTKKKL